MAKARLYFDGDNTYIEKQARIYKMVDEIGDKIDNIPGVINDLNSTSETDALSAAMWKELQDQINAMSWNFHFLSSWDCTTGLPWSDPATDPYVYQSWDYYIVSNTGSTNYKPHWSSYTHWVASTAVETQPVQMNDWYVYDGSTWILQPSGWAQIVVDTALSTTSTNPVENRVITQALNNKQNTISNLSAIESWAAAWATALQPWANITQLTNNAWYQTAWDVATAVSWKQDVLTEGDGIDITNNVISCTVEYTWWTDIEVTSNNVINFTNASWYMLKSSNKLIYATTDTAFNTRDKVCTTAEWNYTPREWDVLALTFNHWCWVGSPRLNIDNSWLHSIVISSTGWANASTLWLGMSKIAWMFVYDWTNRVTWPIKDTTYTAWTWLSLSSWTFTNTQPWPTIWTTAPSSPSEWAMWYDTTNHVLKVYNGTEWTEVGSWWGWGSTTWWNIWGTLSNQTDLQDALDDKLESTDIHWWTGINIQAVWSALPSWYTQLASIQLNWTQALRTNITWVWSTIELDLQCSSTAANVQEICAWDEDYLGTFFWIYWDAFAVQNSTAWKIAGVNVMNRNTISWTFSRNTNPSVSLTVEWNTVSYTRTSNRTDNYLCIWWAISTLSQVLNWFSWYIYSVKVYNTSTSELIANYVPCRDDNNLNVWLYDTVSWTFNTATVWSFVAWPVVPVEWIEISVDPSILPTYTAGTGINITSWVISSTVAWFGNLTYDSSANGNLTATTQQAVAFPSTAKVAFFTWTANHSTSGIRYASWQAVLFKNMFLTSFIWWWDSSNYINGQVWYDWSSYIIYTQDSASTNMRISYVVYFYK